MYMEFCIAFEQLVRRLFTRLIDMIKVNVKNSIGFIQHTRISLSLSFRWFPSKFEYEKYSAI